MCVCVKERERVCVCERERVCVRERERECVREKETEGDDGGAHLDRVLVSHLHVLLHVLLPKRART